MPKRKSSIAAPEPPVPPPAKRITPIPIPSPSGPVRRASSRAAAAAAAKTSTNPDENPAVLDAPDALRASPDSDVNEEVAPGGVKRGEGSESPLSDVPDTVEAEKKTGAAGVKKEGKSRKKAAVAAAAAAPEAKPVETLKKSGVAKAKAVGEEALVSDPEAEGEEEADEEEVKQAVSRPPPVNSGYLPLPWKGRLGYACLNTYLRNANPPVFSSRTCRIASILDHRHPLKDPSQPEHPTKNRPDKDKPADVALGQKYVESLGLANARDIIKMVRWNDKYGIKFLRLSSEMFPFASHEEYGYKLAPFALEVLAEAGKVIAELGHRVTTHPGQFTQLGSPRKSVIDNAIRDLEYHDEMLSLLKLPPQMDRDAVMILHMGGAFGDKAATLDRFRENYAKLSPSIKNRLVLENDDVSWHVHDLLPVCQELNIPMVLDFHHHNILFDKEKIREGTKDIIDLFPTITETWTRKGIRQKMHYSEPTPAAITPMQRRKHNPRPFTLPPCANDMDLMIEAKDKEQAVFELMRNFKLPGWDTINDMIPHVRNDENRPKPAPRKKATPKKRSNKTDDAAAAAAEPDDPDGAEAPPAVVPDDELAMGGPDNRVYWPPGMEEWLRPAKRVVKKKDGEDGAAAAKKSSSTPAQRRKAKAEAEAAAASAAEIAEGLKDEAGGGPAAKKHKRAAPKRAQSASGSGRGSSKRVKSVPTPSTSDGEDEVSEVPELDDDDDEGEEVVRKGAGSGSRRSARAKGAKGVSYVEEDGSE